MEDLREMHSTDPSYEFFTAEHFMKREFFPKSQINFSKDDQFYLLSAFVDGLLSFS